MKHGIQISLLLLVALFILLLPAANAQTMNTSNVMMPEVKAHLDQYLATEKAVTSKQINESVQNHYIKMKSTGNIPIVKGKGALINNQIQNSNSLYESTLSSNIAPTYSMMMYAAHDQGWYCTGIYTPYILQQQYHAQNPQWYQNKAYTVGPGYGGLTAWGWIGYTFTWGGSTGMYNIITTGYESGVTTAVAGGTGTSETDVAIIDNTMNGAYDFRQEHYASCSLGQYDVDQNNINQMMPEKLISGHTYTVYIKVTGSANMWGAGMANSDYDWNNNGIWIYNVYIN